MPLDPRAKRFLDLLATVSPSQTGSMSVEKRRESVRYLMTFAGPLEPVGRVEDRVIPGPGGPIPVRIYTPSQRVCAPMAGLVYFHGGGLVAGTIESHDPICRALANAGACRIVSVDYRLAPEHRFPAAVDDALAAVKYVWMHTEEFGIDRARYGVCGDSAGATLAAVTCQTIVHAGDPRLALQLLICPILDYTVSTESRRAFATGYFVDQSTLNHDLLHYVPSGTDPSDPRISPLRAEHLKDLPPTSIHTAEFDPLRDEGQVYAERLKLAGNDVSYTCHSGMIHLFYALAGIIPYTRTAFAQIGLEIRRLLNSNEAGLELG
jgi:acetyl esterase